MPTKTKMKKQKKSHNFKKMSLSSNISFPEISGFLLASSFFVFFSSILFVRFHCLSFVLVCMLRGLLYCFLDRFVVYCRI